MNATELYRGFVSQVAEHPLLARLFLASMELAVLAALIAGLIWLARIRSARLTSVLWLVVLGKPLVSLVIGSPFQVLQLEAPLVETVAQSTVHAGTRVEPSARSSASPVRPWDGTAEPPMGVVPAVAPEVPQPHLDGNTATATTATERSSAWRLAIARIVVIAWAAGVLWFAVLALLDRIRLRRLISAAQAPRRELSGLYKAAAARLDIERRPLLLETDDLESPAVAGILSPVILVPSWLLDESARTKLEWSLRHELMHVKMWDPLANAIREWAQILFFFHPVTWWAARKWEEAMELACDRALVSSDTESQDYAEKLYEMLVDIRTRRRVQFSSGLFATRTQIGRRIAALLRPITSQPQLGKTTIASVLGLTVVALSVGGGFSGVAGRQANATLAATVDESTPQAQHNHAVSTDKLATADDEIVIGGRVLDPSGEPLAGAKLQVEYPHSDYPASQLSPAFRTDSGPDGRFCLRIAKREFDTSSVREPWQQARLLAAAEGYGFDSVELSTLGSGSDTTLRLAEDIPIRGRILDLQGNPIAGVKVGVRTVVWTPAETLDSYIDAVRQSGHVNFRFERASDGSSIQPVVSSSDGTFQLKGLGAERLVGLYVEGPTIEHVILNVLTRDTETMIRAAAPTEGRVLADSAYGATFDHLAAPSRPIIGTVRDLVTGNPLPGVTVRGSSFRTAETDDAGHFELFGYPKSREYYLQVIPGDSQSYFAASLSISDAPGLEPLRADVELESGKLLQGRITDQASGEPVAGRVEYYPLVPNAAASRRLRVSMPCSATAIRRDGHFVLPVLPGPGVLAIRASGEEAASYPSALISAEELKELLNDGGPPYSEGLLVVAVGGQTQSAILQENYHALALINPDEGMEPVTKDVALEAGRRIRGTVMGPDDQPLSGATVFGLTQDFFIASRPLPTADFEVIALNPRRTRAMLFTHDEKKLGAAVVVEGDQSEPIAVRLEPLGSATGRVLDEDGQPVQDATLQFYRDLLIGPGGSSARTDRDGRFRVDGLVPGQKYQATLLERITVFGDVSVGPGETKDLGDAKVAMRDEAN